MDDVMNKGTYINIKRTTNDVGKHSELLAQTALLSAGFQVLEPISDQAYDLVAKRPDEKEVSYIQVKTVYTRNEPRHNGMYVIFKGNRNNGKIYTQEEVDFFIAVWDGVCYMVPNNEQTEYWVRPENIETSWTRLNMNIK